MDETIASLINVFQPETYNPNFTIGGCEFTCVTTSGNGLNRDFQEPGHTSALVLFTPT